MTAQSSSQRPILIYDGDCPLCRAITTILIASRFVSPDRIQPYGQLKGDAASTVWAAGIRNEMVAILANGAETRTGVFGMLWVLEERVPSIIIKLLHLSLIQQMLTFLYKIVAYNRRIISPSSKGIACTCDPDYSRFYSLCFLACCVVFATIITGLFGASIFRESGLGPPMEGAVQMIGAAGSGWAILSIASARIGGQKQVEYLAHLGATMVVGVVALIPAICLALIVPSKIMCALFILSVVGSFTAMLRMQRSRIPQINLPKMWVSVWVICLLLSSGVWGIWFFAM